MRIDEFVLIAPRAISEFARSRRADNSEDPAAAPVEQESVIAWFSELVVFMEQRDSEREPTPLRCRTGAAITDKR